MDPPREKARLIFRIGSKVEISFEKDGLRDVWFPGFVIEDLGEDLYLVEYKCLGFNDESELRRVTIDYHHMRPSPPLYRDINVGLLEKVDAFYDFGWWSGIITKKLADSRYIVYFKHSNKVKEFSHVELRPHVEWKDGKLVTPYQVPISTDVDNVENGVKPGESRFVKCSAEIRATVSSNLAAPVENTTPATDSINSTEPIEDTPPATVSLLLTEPIKDTTPATVSNLTEQIKDTTPATIQETSIVTSMKRAKETSVVSNDKHGEPFKKLKVGVTSDNSNLSSAEQSKEVSNPPAGQSGRVKKANIGAKTIEATNSVSHGKRTRSASREKGVESNSPMTTSEQKKGKTSADNRGQKTSTKGDTGDSTKVSASDIVEVEHVNKDWLIRHVVMGLPCKAMALGQIKKPNQLTSGSHPEIAEAKTPKSAVQLSPKTTGNQEVEESATDTVQKRKRGRPFKVKRQVESRKTPLAEINENGDAVPAAVAASKQKDTPSTALVNGDNMPNRGSGVELTLPEEAYKTVKGKRGKRRSISSVKSPTQESSKQTANGGLEIDSTTENSEPPVEAMLDDQPLSRWVEGIQSSAVVVSTVVEKKQLENSKSPSAVANGNDEALSFEKQSSLWKMFESMEVFRKHPQTPHFRPLDELNQKVRERHAIDQMINFSGVVEDMSRLRHNNQKSYIEDHLKTLSTLETHGFDVKKIRDRLMEMLPLKSSCEELEKEWEKSREKIVVKNDGGQTIDKEIQEIDKQISEMHEKRGVVLSKKMNHDSDISDLNAEHNKIQDALREVARHFDELAAAPL